MQCYIYRSTRKQGLYIYLDKIDDFSALPAALLKQTGKLELALELALTPDKKLHCEDAARVINNLSNQGYHVQMPQSVESLLKLEN